MAPSTPTPTPPHGERDGTSNGDDDAPVRRSAARPGEAASISSTDALTASASTVVGLDPQQPGNQTGLLTRTANAVAPDVSVVQNSQKANGTARVSSSRPGAVFEKADSAAATRAKHKGSSTTTPSVPVNLQNLDDAIQAKMQGHDISTGPMAEARASKATAAAADLTRPGAFSVAAMHRALRSSSTTTAAVSSSTDDAAAIKQRAAATPVGAVMEQRLDTRIDAKVARTWSSSSTDSLPPASAMTVSQQQSRDDRHQAKIARSLSSSSDDDSYVGSMNQYDLDDRIQAKVARSLSSSSSESLPEAKSRYALDDRIQAKVARSTSSSSSESIPGATAARTQDDRSQAKVARSASSSSSESIPGATSARTRRVLDDRIRVKVARSSSSDSLPAVDGSAHASLQTLEDRIHAKAAAEQRTMSQPATHPSLQTLEQQIQAKIAGVSGDVTVGAHHVVTAAAAASNNPTHASLQTLEEQVHSKLAAERGAMIAQHANLVDASLHNLDNRIRSKANHAPPRTFSSSSTASSQDSSLSDDSMSMFSMASTTCDAKMACKPPVSLQDLDNRIQAKVGRTLSTSSQSSEDDSVIANESQIADAALELHSLDHRIRSKVSRTRSSSSTDSRDSASTSSSMASSIALDSLDARIDEKRNTGPPRRMQGFRGSRRPARPGPEYGTGSGGGGGDDNVVVTLAKMPRQEDAPYSDDEEPTTRRHNLSRNGGLFTNSDDLEYSDSSSSSSSSSHRDGLIAQKSMRDLELGDHTNLAVAFAVVEDDDMYLPSAIEYEPDAKPPLYRNRRFRLYIFLAMELVILVAVGTIIGILLSNEGRPSIAPLSDRATLGIREYIERIVGSEPLNDPANPYRKAWVWIQDVDPMALEPGHEKFAQRFLAAYFYYETSVDKPWADGCSAATPDQLHEGNNDCIHTTKNVIESFEQFEVAAKRWLSAADECLWAGVTCDGQGQIDKLDFSGSNMTGTFPGGIASFPFLHFLSLSHSELKGSLPDRTGDLKHLNNLEVANNRFTGSIPDSFYGFRALYKANLGENNIAGSISTSIGKLRDMKRLYAYQNQLTGTIPTEVGRLRSVAYLGINGNALSGAIPTELGYLKRVNGLSLQRNHLNGTLPTELGMASMLTDLRLHENRLTGRVPIELSNIPLLDFLELNDNLLTGDLLPFTNMTAMNELHIQRNLFTGTIPTGLGALKAMTEFAASGNQLTGAVPRKVCNLVMPANKPESAKVLSRLELDCAASLDGAVEIDCPCCTQCCDRDGTSCNDVL